MCQRAMAGNKRKPQKAGDWENSPSGKCLEEASRRGAEYFDSFLTEENDMFAAISGQQKQLGFIPIARYPDHYIKDGEKINIMVSHLRTSLMPLKERASNVERGTTEQKNVRNAHGGT
jgi:hypothetical protein